MINGGFEFAVRVLPLDHKFLIVKNEQHRSLYKTTLNLCFSKAKNYISHLTILKENVNKSFVKLIEYYLNKFKYCFCKGRRQLIKIV